MNHGIRSLLWMSFFAAMTALGGFIRIPTPLVPFTLQTLFVYLTGDLLGSKRGAFSQLLFLTLGLLGVPVFTAGGGPGYILQPTFGYLVSFPAGAWIVGKVVERLDKPGKWWGWFLANGAGLSIIFTMGVGYLYVNVNFIMNKTLSVSQAVWSGVLIFLPGEVVKIFLAATLARRLRSFIDIV